MTDLNLVKFDELQKESSPIVAKAKSYVIKTEKDIEDASAFLLTINTQLKKIEASRLDLTAPMNQVLSKINAAAKRASEPLKEAKEILSSNILEWRREAQKRIAAEEERRRKIQESHAAKGHNVSAPVELERPDKTIGNAQARKVLKWRVIDKNIVPETLKVIDNVLVNNEIKRLQKTGEKLEIRGLEIYEDEILAIR